MTPEGRRSSSEARTVRRSDVGRLRARIRELEQENTVLEAEKAALEGYAALAAHELVTPLVIAESYASLVSDRLSEPEHEVSRHYLASLARSASRARILVETLLHEARAGGSPLHMRPVDLGRVVRELVDALEPEIDQRHASIEVEELPQVLGDEALLQAVFTNLIMNALKYGARQDGNIRIAAERGPHEWRFVIDSGGPPIAPEDRDVIFAPYNRARGERRERGVGLGLAICQRIVERHGGTIGVTEGEGSGNRFYFTIPAR
jgi:two-component system, chemotaxis family, sensor kinase Cph1